MKTTKGPYTLQTLTLEHKGYDWPVFTIRSQPENHCLAVVGETDRATVGQNHGNATLFCASWDLLKACEALTYALSSINFEGGNIPTWILEALTQGKTAIEKAGGLYKPVGEALPFGPDNFNPDGMQVWEVKRWLEFIGTGEQPLCANQWFPNDKHRFRYVRDMRAYLWNKLTAMQCRLDGKIQTAIKYEEICDRIYAQLPEAAKW